MSPRLSTPPQGAVTSNARTDECTGHVTTQRAGSARQQGEDEERVSGEENLVKWSS